MRPTFVVLSLAAFGCTGGSGSGGDGGAPEGGTVDGGAVDAGTDGAAEGGCTTAATGTIAVTVTGLPAGVKARLNVIGQGGTQTQTVQATTNLAPVQSGDYKFTASTVGDSDPIVRRAFKGAVSIPSAHLCDGQTVSVDVTYSLIASSNKIWWGSGNSTSDTLGFASSTLAASGTPAATVAANTKGTIPGAFDPDGNLWVIDGTTGAEGVKRYPAETLGASGDKTPDVVVTSGAFTGGTPGASSIAFDASGDMWVGVIFSQKVVELSAGSLGASGMVTPSVEIGNVNVPNALAFDANGNLWIGSGDNVLEYKAARLSASTSAPADVSIASQSPPPVVSPLTNALGLAFNKDGELWVDYDGTLAKLTTTDLASSGTVTPAIQVKADVLALPSGIALDESGGLWMAYSAGKICGFGASQLGASGSVAPQVVVTSASLGSATSPALFPAPAALPLYSAVP
jgi:ligand-binding sensor domain-containing protein